MGNKQYSFGMSNQGDQTIRNKAKLDDGTIVEYDSCCMAGEDPGFGPKMQTKYLGRGTIYEIGGTRQYEGILGSRVDYYDFWRVFE